MSTVITLPYPALVALQEAALQADILLEVSGPVENLQIMSTLNTTEIMELVVMVMTDHPEIPLWPTAKIHNLALPSRHQIIKDMELASLGKNPANNYPNKPTLSQLALMSFIKKKTGELYQLIDFLP